ncbi:DUF4291 domain-containing protein [Streptomyces beijiangensis]|uniref:DUF4291 domain-containing protein n=1 Tax=Streptomyces beijiangensis TaxID=163361 RepID=A0A939FCS8_9ACTN|nr:DUF4291 domain-containing protein [Streptomyces beijiangensis]MBO0516247.1 DUF4291 domain-containing protein [Streptomyces beijiangensis]
MTDRLVRAAFTESTVTVYQAYPAAIADPAVEAGTFVSPFKVERMTWIKPSFLWMMYRSGWAEKPGQERVLAVEITRAGFEWALGHASLSHFDRTVHSAKEDWRAELKESPVRIQWDPDRSMTLNPLEYRAIQVGLSGESVKRYVEEWITGITDITPLVHSIRSDIRAGDVREAARKLPDEVHYPLSDALRQRVGAHG